MMNLKKFLPVLSLSLLPADPLAAHNPTWTDGIACIIYSHCTSCHNPKGIAPFSLATYNDVYQNRYAVAASVQAGSMPPFPPSQKKQRYAHANTLSDHEVKEIADWVNNFAPLGDANAIPTPPAYNSGYSLSNPDKVLKIPTYTVNTTKDLYRCFVLPLNNNSAQFIRQIEVVPGSRDIVHHALIFQDTSGKPLSLDNADPLPGYTAFGGTGSSSSVLITGYTPGQGLFEYPQGFGARVNAKSYIIIQIHYPGGISNRKDSTQVRIKYGTGTPRNISTAPILNHSVSLKNGPLSIPPNVVKTFYAEYKINVNVTVTGVFPHMHLIGRSIKAYFLSPSRDTTWLVDVPQWDFHWQGFYSFRKPILVPAGSTLYGEATYDNTVNNPNNPNSPPITVNQGEGTADEMFLVYFNYTGYVPGDTNIIIDTASHLAHHASCFNTSGNEELYTDEITLAPNPVRDCLTVRGLEGNFNACLYSGEGRVVLQRNMSGAVPLDVSALPAGVYYLRIQSANIGVRYVKVQKE